MTHCRPRCAIRCNKQAGDIYGAEVRFITCSGVRVICTAFIYTLQVRHTLRFFAMQASYGADSKDYYHMLSLCMYTVVLVMDFMTLSLVVGT